MKILFVFSALMIGHSLLFKTGLLAQSDVTSPSDPIIGGQMIGGVFVQATQGTPVGNANMFPFDGKPSFAIDNDFTTSKYRNFGEINTGFIVTPTFGQTVVTSLRVWTGSNSPEWDPLTFTLEGTNGDPLTGLYSLIASGSAGVDIDPGRSEGGVVQTFSTDSSRGGGFGSGFTSYRLIFPTVRNSGTADSMQVTEVQIRGVLAPEPTAFTLLGLSAIGLFGSRRRR